MGGACLESLARERGVLLSPVMLLPPWHGAQVRVSTLTCVHGRFFPVFAQMPPPPLLHCPNPDVDWSCVPRAAQRSLCTRLYCAFPCIHPSGFFVCVWQWPHVMQWWRLPRPPYRPQRLPVSRCNHRPMSDCLTRCVAQALGSVALSVLTKAQRHLLLLVPCKVPACVV